MTDNRYEAPLSNVSLSEVRTSYLKSWVVFVLLSTVGGFLAGAIAGGLIGGVLGASGAGVSIVRACSSVAGFVAALPISYMAFRWSAAKYLVGPLLVRGDAASPGREA